MEDDCHFVLKRRGLCIKMILEQCVKMRRDSSPGQFAANRWRSGFVVCILAIVVPAVLTAQDARIAGLSRTGKLLEYLRAQQTNATLIANADSLHDNKCGFWVRALIHSQWQRFTATQKNEIQKLLQQGSYQKDRIIGRFHIFYDTTGLNEPALLTSDSLQEPVPNTAEAFVDSVGRIFNEVYHVEVDLLGYDAPPFEPGETQYRVLIGNISDYGWTNWDPTMAPLNSGSPAPRYPCYVEINNTFKDFYTKGMDALRVTAAHEFHHVIQIGSYGFWQDDVYAHELTSTWMEDVVYTDVNDYYQYLPWYFMGFSGGLAFNSDAYGGYERAVWAHFLAKRFGADIMREVWTDMRTQGFLQSTDAVLQAKGTSLQSEFALFTYWNYFTGNRADTIKYYPEGNHYPRFLPFQTVPFSGGTATEQGNVQPLSSSMYEFDVPIDTITAIVANVDVADAENRIATTSPVVITLTSNGQISPPYQQLANGWRIGASVTPPFWRTFFVDTASQLSFAQSNAAPNPFRLAGTVPLVLPIQDPFVSSADVYFLSSSLRLVYSAQYTIQTQLGTRVIEIDSGDLKSKLSSGIYFIFAKTAHQEYRWKVAVIR
jgi:hypothetical protein